MITYKGHESCNGSYECIFSYLLRMQTYEILNSASTNDFLWENRQINSYFDRSCEIQIQSIKGDRDIYFYNKSRHEGSNSVKIFSLV